MKHRLLLAFLLLLFSSIMGCDRKEATTAQAPVPTQAPALPPNSVEGGGIFLSKEASFARFRTTTLPRAKSEVDFLGSFSNLWISQSKNAQDIAGQIADPELRVTKLRQLMATIDKGKCLAEAEQEYRKQNEAYESERRTYFSKRQGDWYEIAELRQFGIDDNNPPESTLSFRTTATNLIEKLNHSETKTDLIEMRGGRFNIKMDLMDIDKIYTSGKILAKNEAAAEVEEYFSVIRRNVQGLSPNELKYRWGLDSYAQLEQNIEADRPKAIEEAAKKYIYKRLFMVATGDVIDGKIEKLGIIDYPSNKLIYLFNSSIIEAFKQAISPEPTIPVASSSKHKRKG